MPFPVKDFITKEGISNLIEGFERRTLPAAQWTHEAHLITGLWYNFNHSALEAICILRSGIISYNISSGGINTPEKGYHETLTLFWSRILSDFVTRNQGLTLVELCDKFLKSEWSSKDLPLQYYSRDLLFSLQARALWVAPDLRNL
jgi:hypothetical protein